MVIIITFMLVVSTLLGCANHSPLSKGERESMHFAQGIEITHYADYTKVEIRNPWDTTRLMKRYLLVSRDEERLPTNMESGEVVRIPVRRAAIYSSVHASIIEMLGQEDAIVGVCEVQYIDSEVLQGRIRRGEIANLGESTSPNIERILDTESEVIISSPFKDTGYGAAEKLGIPIIEGADYMEQHPLGRVEWIRFYGMLFGADSMANAIYDQTSREYIKLKELAQNTPHRPTVFSDTKYGGSWFVAGGESYSAVLFNDAGADYIFKDDSGSGSIQMSFEQVLDRAIDADFWLIKYYGKDNMSYQSLSSEYEPYANFGAFKRRRIYGCNTSAIKYYEQTPMHPHHLLRNLIHIFHPELLPDYTPEFYSPIE
ncbi:MAG: ABC transporter substrate-binding protein [Rikenellaceae bacterium]